MNNHFLSTVRALVTSAWRRRYLLALPVMIMLPISMLWALYGPRTYIAKSLMLLQETAPTNPLARPEGGGQPVRIQDRIAGLQALLKSERVLGGVYRDLSGDAGGASRDMAIWMRDFSQYLSVDLIGSDFLEFQLKGGSPRGLGKRLEAVTSRFLEALSPEQNAQFASQVLLDRRKEEMDTAERALALFRLRLGEQLPRGLSEPQNRLEDVRKHLQVKDGQLKRAIADVQETRGRLFGNPSGSNRIEQELVKVRAEVAALESNGGGSAELARSRARLADLMGVQKLEGQRAQLEAELKELNRVSDMLMAQVRQSQPLAGELSRLEREAASAKEAYDDYFRRYSRVAATRTSGILNAPERIKLIDAPRDPEFPSNSALRIAIVTLLGSIFLALGLAVCAELLDQRVYRPEEAADATGLPIVGRVA